MGMRFFLLAVVLAACSSSPPRPQGGGQQAFQRPMAVASPMGLFYAGLDRDSDGVTLRSEVEEAAPTLFARTDTDGNGALRPLEFRGFIVAYLGTDDAAIGVNDFDRDMDGAVSQHEFSAMLLHRFGRMDRDGSGTLERSELVRTLEPPSSRRGGQGGGQGGAGGGRGGGRR